MMRTKLSAAVVATALLAGAVAAKATVILYGDADVLGTGTYSSNPTDGATLEGLLANQITSGSLIQLHSFPFAPSGDYSGTDQIYVGSTQTAHHDGYSNYAGRLNGPQTIAMSYASAIPQGHHVETLTLGIAADDFQSAAFGQPFSAWINGIYNATLSAGLNSLDQTGPRVQFHTIGISPSVLNPQDILTLTIDEGGTGGDGWAIDFLTVGVTTAPDPATIGVSDASGATIITGGTAAVGATVTNTAGAGHADLDYTLGAAVTVGAAGLGPVSPGSGSLAPGVSQPNTVNATSTNVGDNTVRFTAADPDATNSPQTADVTLTVLDHSHASFDETVLQTAGTIDFGRVLRYAPLTGHPYRVWNIAMGHPAADTAGLDLDSFTPDDAGPLRANLSTFTNLPAGTSNSPLATLDTSVSGTYGRTVTIGLSDQDLPGAGEPNSQTLTLQLNAVVGHAIADSSNSPDAFGPPLTAVSSPPFTYARLESTVVGTLGSGSIGGDDEEGQPAVGTTATLLAGSNTSGVDAGVTMAWRTRTTSEAAVFGDVVSLGRMVNDGGPSGETDVFVLRMDYDESLLPDDEATLAAGGGLFLGWLDPHTGQWVNAIRGNYGENVGATNVQGPWGGTMDLGAWGVDVHRNAVWAVLNHNSQFSPTPEPATLALLGLGACATLLRRKRR